MPDDAKWTDPAEIMRKASQRAQGRIAEDDRKEIISKLNERLGDRKCPMCGQGDFMVADAFVAVTLQPDFAQWVVGGRNLPSVPIICRHCGATFPMNLVILGLTDILARYSKPSDKGASS